MSLLGVALSRAPVRVALEKQQAGSFVLFVPMFEIM